MMSGHVLHAGEGYAYLMRSVATNDEPTSVKTGLFDYYESHGTPPGTWWGTGLQALNSESAVAGATVTEDQMAALFGEGLHPDSDEMISRGATMKDVQLGRAFPLYSGKDPVVAKLNKAEKAAVADLGRRLTKDERTDIAVATVRDDYHDATGETNPHPKDVAAWANKRKQDVKQATSGFDFTFSPPKSVSMLWALGDNETRKAIEDIHHQTVNHTLNWFENNALYTRDSTRGGGGLVRTSGMLAAQFDHFDTRAGDPDLHTHVAIANKVYDPESDKWKSIDSRSTLRHIVTASARYNTLLMDQLSAKLGVAISARDMGEGKRPVHEIAGIPEELITAGSKRRAQVTEATEKLVEEYFDKHGRAPSAKTMHELAQQATLATRPDKAEAQSLAQLRGGWRDEFAAVVGGPEPLDDLLAGVHGEHATTASLDARLNLPEPGDEHYPGALDAVADQAVALAADRRSHFAERHLDSAVSDILRGYKTPESMSVDDLHDAVYLRAAHRAVELSPREVWNLPEAMTHLNGQAIDRNPGDTYFTSRAVMAMEDTIVAAATSPVGFIATEETIQSAIADYNADSKFDVNDGQEAMIRHLASSGTQTAAAVGPAGTGKTTSMKVLADIWRRDDHNVIALSTQRTAAKGLADEIDADGYTLDSLTRPWRGEFDGTDAKDLTGLPVALSPGDMLLVDEAGMASTDNLAAITEIAEASGAVLRMIGDPAQLSAVGRGGAFDHLCKVSGATELDTVVRMGADKEQSDNTLALRHGDTKGLDLYFDRGWVHDGTRADMLDEAVSDHLADRAAGHHGLLIAPTNQDVSAANQRIREALIANGTVSNTDVTARLTDSEASCGDTILARKNTRYIDPASNTRVEVSNGEMFRLDCVGPDGSVMAHRLDGKGRAGESIVLPKDYLESHCQLGYASTVHRAQGATVAICRAIIDAFQSRELAYVATTRGAKQNHIYAVTDDKRTAAELGDIVDRDGAEAHMAGHREDLDARELLTHVLNNSQAPESASGLRDRLAAEGESTDRATKLYRTAANKLTDSWAQHAVSDAVDHLPALFASEISEADQHRIATALAGAATSGADAETALQEAFDLDGSERDIPAVITHRIKSHTLDTDRDHSPVLPPRWLGEDTQLRIFAEDTSLRLAGLDAGPVDDIDVLNRQYAETWVERIAGLAGDKDQITDTDRERLITTAAAATRSGADIDTLPPAIGALYAAGMNDGQTLVELAATRLDSERLSGSDDHIPGPPDGQDIELRRKIADELGITLDIVDHVNHVEDSPDPYGLGDLSLPTFDPHQDNAPAPWAQPDPGNDLGL
ncbi:MobF family relaxase [Corynebacterium sp. AOP40-9SA-29]|uniref:MobF family relaxase n=1 Tax=Corynebacterium sp. AOP40-9SA-29 TaxID=3457677 RepID=UPI00403447C3